MCRRQQNKWYHHRCSLAHFEAALDFNLSNLLSHNNVSQNIITVVNCSFSDNMSPLGCHLFC